MALKEWQRSVVDDRGVLLPTWGPLAAGDTTNAYEGSYFSDRSVQVVGTFGGAHAIIQGSHDGTNWSTINDPQGVPLDFSSAGLKQLQEITRYIRPLLTGGDGTTALTVYLLARSPL